MKKMFFLLTVFGFILSACIPAALQPQAAANPAPVSEADIQATVAVRVEQTIQSLPTPSLAPSNTPVVMTVTSAPTQTQTKAPPTFTATQNPPVLTLTATATLGTSTMIVTVGTVGTLPLTATPSLTQNPAFSVTPEGSHYQYYGTMPPNLPFGRLNLSNKSKSEAYISLQCTTIDGYETIIEYPVDRHTMKTSAPAGAYFYVAWVGGKKFTGSFRLSKLAELTITIYKDHVEVK
jgi:hypothetical protein